MTRILASTFGWLIARAPLFLLGSCRTVFDVSAEAAWIDADSRTRYVACCAMRTDR